MPFPGATPSYPGFTPGHTLLLDVHASQHNAEQADITALSNKVGTGASTPTSGLFLRGNGTGTSAWGQVQASTDITGVVPVANLPLSTLLASIYPVGCIYTEITGVDPNITFGFGTWAAFGSGKTLVGVDTGQTEFNTVQKTGGEKTHLLTTVELASHTHAPTDPGHQHALNGNVGNRVLSPDFNNGTASASGAATWGSIALSAALTGITIGSAGSDNAHNNLQPYITVYFWRRTA